MVSITVLELFPYEKYKVVQVCNIVVTRLFTRNNLLTTLLAAYDNLVLSCFILHGCNNHVMCKHTYISDNVNSKYTRLMST